MPWDSVRETHGNSDISKVMGGWVCSVDNKYVCSMVGKKTPWNKKLLQADMGRIACLWWIQWGICSRWCRKAHHLKAEVVVLTLFTPCYRVNPTGHLIPPGLKKSISLPSCEKRKTDCSGCISSRLRPSRCWMCAASCSWLTAFRKCCYQCEWESCSTHGPRPVLSSFQTKSLARNGIFKFFSNII